MTNEVSKFIQANGDLGGTTLSVAEVTALNYLVTNLKLQGLYPTSGALYPLVGSNATTHSLNLLDPSAYRLSWVNDSSGNHSANGWTNSGSAEGQTGLNATDLGNNVSFVLYSRTSGGSGGVDMGRSGPSGGNPRLLIHLQYSDGKCYFDAYSFANTGERVSASNTAAGLTVPTANGRVRSIHKNGVQLVSATASANPPTVPSLALSVGRESSNQYASTGRQFAMLGIINAVDPATQSAFYTIIQNFQTILNRQV